MNVLHHSFSLSACPKCHLLVCQHTSLADLNFNPDQQQSVNETNLYLFPSDVVDIRYSWTTCGTESIESTQTLKNTEVIPFANESRVHSSSSSSSATTLDPLQLEGITSKLSIDLTKSLSYSTLYEPSSQIQHEDHASIKSHSRKSFSIFSFLILSFLFTNILDIVLIYIYYRTNSFYFFSFLSTIILCDFILWINHLLQYKTTLSYLLLIPFMNRFYLLYELIDFLTLAFDKHEQLHRSDSLSSTTLELQHDTTLIRCSRKQKLYYELSVFYLLHTGLFSLINFYFWSNNFELSIQSSIHMNYFLPRWLSNDVLSPTESNALPVQSPTR
ncbi:unnamed protein product [Adineta ricciae]|uniref:Uncharacterized protein n=1 Tax=Adineta ricciae TaxID=249248 RepID=A0A813S3M0_ADIRI|nr:unnamed protein product [Adineta ricciae]CAF1522266.1 unnamed protein product [Adineta ricciae]